MPSPSPFVAYQFKAARSRAHYFVCLGGIVLGALALDASPGRDDFFPSPFLFFGVEIVPVAFNLAMAKIASTLLLWMPIAHTLGLMPNLAVMAEVVLEVCCVCLFRARMGGGVCLCGTARARLALG